MEQLGSHWTDFHTILHLSIFRKSCEKIQVSLESTITGSAHKDKFTFMIIPRSVLFQMETVSDKIIGENRKNILCSIT